MSEPTMPVPEISPWRSEGMSPFNEDLFPAYFGLLGEFIHAFGMFERVINEVVRDVVGWSLKATGQAERDLLAAVLPAPGYEVARKAILIILEVLRVDKSIIDEVSITFSHVGHIQKFRNDVTHSSAQPEIMAARGVFVMHNLTLASKAEKREVIYFELQAVHDMISDLYSARIHLRNVIGSARREAPAWPEPTWRFKPTSVHRQKN